MRTQLVRSFAAAGRDAASTGAAAAELDDDTEAGFDAQMRAKALAKRSALQGAAPGGWCGPHFLSLERLLVVRYE